MEKWDETDESLGIIRCVRCGHRLDGEIECPFCSVFPEDLKSEGARIPRWMFFLVCLLTSPLSIYWIIKTQRLSTVEKVLAAGGFILWVLFFHILR